MTTKRKPKKAEDLRVRIMCDLRLQGSSFSAVARRLKISRQAVREGIVDPSPRIAKEVARILGKRPGELWPHRYVA